MSDSVFYNCGHAKDARLLEDILRLIKSQDPDLLFLCEAGDRHPVVRDAARLSGYAAHIGDGQPGADRLAVLTAPRVTVEAVRAVKIGDRTYVGRRTAGARRTGWAPAKYILSVRYHVRDDDGKKRYRTRGGTHLVPSAMKRGNTATRNLHGRQVDACTRWLRSRHREALIGGDFNADPTRKGERPLLAPLLARFRWGGEKPTHGRRSIDLAFGTFPFTVTPLAGYSSDHRPIVITRGEA